jgi:hypothetical protein
MIWRYPHFDRPRDFYRWHLGDLLLPHGRFKITTLAAVARSMGLWGYTAICGCLFQFFFMGPVGVASVFSKISAKGEIMVVK